MTPEERRIVSSLTSAQVESIDRALLQNTTSNWRKVARIVGFTMIENGSVFAGVPDGYYAERIRKMVSSGVLEAQGELSAMRFCEVRTSKIGGA